MDPNRNLNRSLNVKKEINNIIYLKYFMILYNNLNPIQSDKQKEYFIKLLNQIAELFDITYSKESWATVFG